MWKLDRLFSREREEPARRGLRMEPSMGLAEAKSCRCDLGGALSVAGSVQGYLAVV